MPIVTESVPIPEEGAEMIVSNTGGYKQQKDVQLHAIPWESLQELGKVYNHGAKKYVDDYNFRKGYRWSLSFDAMVRHLWQFWSGEDRDSESGLHHLAHATWHGIALLLFSLKGLGTDDRPNN